jgi:hypothetical protein
MNNYPEISSQFYSSFVGGGQRNSKHEFLILLRELVDILDAVQGSGVEFFVGIANEPAQKQGNL